MENILLEDIENVPLEGEMYCDECDFIFYSTEVKDCTHVTSIHKIESSLYIKNNEQLDVKSLKIENTFK